MLRCLLSYDGNVHRDDVLHAIVFLEDFSFLEVLYAGLDFLQLNRKGLLLLPEFVHLAGETHSFPVELDHDGSSDAVIDLSEVVGVDDLLDEVVSFSHCSLNKYFVVLFAADGEVDCFRDVAQLILELSILELLVVGLNDQILCLLLFVSLKVSLLLGFSLHFLQPLDGLTCFFDFNIKFLGLIAGLGEVLLEGIVLLIQGTDFSFQVLCLVEQLFFLMFEVLLMRKIVDIASQ